MKAVALIDACSFGDRFKYTLQMAELIERGYQENHPECPIELVVENLT